jgi:hypothetical protein
MRRGATNGKRMAGNMAHANVLIAYGNAQHLLHRGGEVIRVAKGGVERFVGGDVTDVTKNQGE